MTKYFLAGSTSELGNRVAKGLVNHFGANKIICLVRTNSDNNSIKYLKELGVSIEVGDVTEPDTLHRLLNPDTIYIDMTHPKYYDKSIDVVKQAGVKRAFFVTTTGIYSRYNQCSDIYKEGEAKIKASGIEYTIIRPSMIYGTERDRNMTRLLKYLSRYPIFPIFGDGKALMQPVYVQDLADGIVIAIDNPELTSSKEYNLCGPISISYMSLIKTACDIMGKRVQLIHISHRMAFTLVGLAQKLPKFPIKQEQVMRLAEDKAFDISLAQKELGYTPRGFSEGIREEVACLKSKGIIL